MTSTLYVCTAYAFNHESRFGYKRWPLDERFLNSPHDIRFFLIDGERPDALANRKVLFERQIDPRLAAAGARHLAEWSFLLAEAKHGFCAYPFFFTSSRFHQKNLLLRRDLNDEWATLFEYLIKYGWGYLPSYDRPLAWIDLTKNPFPITNDGLELIDRLFDIKIPEQYRYFSDFQCNYIGFATRQNLLEYVNFYKPLFEAFFDDDWKPRHDLSRYVGHKAGYRNEKPVTFIIEMLSHLFFFKRGLPFFGLHYDGYYEVDERNTRFKKLQSWTPLTDPRAGEGKLEQPWIYRGRWSPARWLADGMMAARLRQLAKKAFLKI